MQWVYSLVHWVYSLVVSTFVVINGNQLQHIMPAQHLSLAFKVDHNLVS